VRLERGARDALHDEGEAAAAQSPHGVDGDDVRVLELRDGARLAAEPRDRVVVGRGGARVDDLDGHVAPEGAVARPVDDGGAAASELADQFVVVLQLGEFRGQSERGGHDRDA
jgi:hypothetical protein